MFIANYLKPELEPDYLSRLSRAGLRPSNIKLVGAGLADAVKRISKETGFGVKVYAQKIPFEGNSFTFGSSLNIDPISAAMNGGEDLQLLFVLPISKAEILRKDFADFDIIGHLAQSNVGTVLVTPEGIEIPLKAQGWDEEDFES